MSVVGYDFGNEACFIAVARAGGIETIDNDYSQRQTPSCVAFSDKQRILGVGAKNQTNTNPKNTIHGFKRLIGRKFNDPVVQAERPRVPFKMVPTPSGGTGIQVQYLGQTTVFTIEQVTAMLFTKLRETTEHALQVKSQDCVLSCPSYFTAAQRQALLDAAAMAGLNVLRILNESSATALSYGIYKQDLPGEEETPRNVVFIDCGHSALQVFVCAFNKGKLKMLACTADPFLGGRDFDDVLAKYFCDDFKKRYNVDGGSHPKSYIRLLSEVEKLKKQMSANSTPLPLSIESWMEVDVHGTMCRADFEKMSAPLLERVQKTLTKCLHDSKLSLTEIHSVEIVGGTSRIPAIKTLIEKVFGQYPSTTLNQDEAVARGCALECAIMSPTFKVRDFILTDVQAYPVKLRFQELDGSMADMDLFPQYHPFPFAKMVTFYRKEPFEMTAYYSSDIPYPDPMIAEIAIKNLKPPASGENYKVKVKLRMNVNGILETCTAIAYEKMENAEEPMETLANDIDPDQASNSEDGNGTPKSDAQPLEMETNQNQAETEGEGKKSETEEKKSPTKPKKQQFKTIELIYETMSHALPRKELVDYMEQEGKMVAEDRQEKERIDAKNNLEEYVYNYRELLENDLKEYVTDSDRSTYLANLNDQLNWLYEDGADELRQVYIQRLDELKKVGEPIKERLREFNDCPSTLENFSVAISRVRKVIEACKNKDPTYDHLDKNDVKILEKEVHGATQWFETTWGALKAAKKIKDCPTSVNEISSKTEKFSLMTATIINKPKPKVEPPKEDKEKSDKLPQENNTDAKPEEQENGAKMEVEHDVD